MWLRVSNVEVWYDQWYVTYFVRKHGKMEGAVVGRLSTVFKLSLGLNLKKKLEMFTPIEITPRGGPMEFELKFLKSMGFLARRVIFGAL